MGSRIHGLLDCGGVKVWPVAGAARYVDLGNLRMSYHTRHTSRLPTITSATSLIRGDCCHRADRQACCSRPLWYFMEHIALRTTLPAVLQVDSWRALFSAYAASEAREPLFLTQYLWPFYSIILFTWASLYYGVNAILDLESERANVVNALKLADTARLRALQSNLNPHFLFNALNGIATLVREQDSVTARGHDRCPEHLSQVNAGAIGYS